MSTPLFSLDNFHCIYPGQVQPVLKIDQLKIPKGKVVFLLGASGLGKSTLLEALGLMNSVVGSDLGSIMLHLDAGSPIDVVGLWHSLNLSDTPSVSNESAAQRLASIRRNISFIFQRPALFEHLSWWENIEMAARLKGKWTSELEEETMAMAARLNIKAPKNKSVSNFSGGQQQRISILRALASTPEILLCDEPTGDLDPVMAQIVMNLIVESCQRKKLSVIIVSHDLELALRHGDQILILSPGGLGKGEGTIAKEGHFQREGLNWIGKQEKYSSSDVKLKMLEAMRESHLV